MKVKTSKGFTLAELLIVMAIIVVLAAIAIPTFGKQLETARETSDAEAIRTVATDAFTEVYTKCLTTANVPVGAVYFSPSYPVAFGQSVANFNYMSPSIKVGTSDAVAITKTPTLAEGSALPATAYLQFKFTVQSDGSLGLTDILAAGADVEAAHAVSGGTSSATLTLTGATSLQ